MNLDVSEWVALGQQLARITNDVNDPKSLRSAMHEEAKAIRHTWREDARAKAGTHGKHYPASITYETKSTGPLAVQAVIGPDPSKKQGGMNFEFGTRQSAPHLSGQKAAQEAEGRLEQRMNDWLDGVGL